YTATHEQSTQRHRKVFQAATSNSACQHLTPNFKTSNPLCPIRCCARVRNYAAKTASNAVHNKRTRRARPRSGPKKVTVIDRAEITVGYLHACGDLETFLALAGDAELRSRSAGTRWTNEELLFHMVFGYMVTRRLQPLVKCFGRLPPSMGN